MPRSRRSPRERVGHRDADRTLVQPLRTLAHPPGRREQPRLTGQPEHALAARAHTFALEPSPKLCGCPSPTNGESASATRISASSSPSFIAPTGPGLRRVIAETLRRRRCSHAADRDTPATRHTVFSGAGSSLLTASASATEGGPSSPVAPAGCRPRVGADQPCVAHQLARVPRPAAAATSGPHAQASRATRPATT